MFIFLAARTHARSCLDCLHKGQGPLRRGDTKGDTLAGCSLLLLTRVN